MLTLLQLPNSSKSRKEYLVLTCGPPSLSTALPKSKEEDEESCSDDEGSEEDDEDQAVSFVNYTYNHLHIISLVSPRIYNWFFCLLRLIALDVRLRLFQGIPV